MNFSLGESLMGGIRDRSLSELGGLNSLARVHWPTVRGQRVLEFVARLKSLELAPGCGKTSQTLVTRSTATGPR